jgi:hypothetical protein
VPAAPHVRATGDAARLGARVARLEKRLERLSRLVHADAAREASSALRRIAHELSIQFTRIAQIQTELDALKRHVQERPRRRGQPTRRQPRSAQCLPQARPLRAGMIVVGCGSEAAVFSAAIPGAL